MSRVKRFLLGGVILVTILGAASFSTLRAFPVSTSQISQGDSGQITQALLSEVHQLRLAIQRSNLNTYHAQVTLERLRLQQQQVDRLNDKLGGARALIARLQIDKSRLQGDLPRLEAQLSQESDPGRRREMENQQLAIKLEVERQLETISQQRELESQLSGQVQVEQAKLNELNDRLDTLQKELENVDKPQPKR
jgi:hypothetical protein